MALVAQLGDDPGEPAFAERRELDRDPSSAAAVELSAHEPPLLAPKHELGDGAASELKALLELG